MPNQKIDQNTDNDLSDLGIDISEIDDKDDSIYVPKSEKSNTTTAAFARRNEKTGSQKILGAVIPSNTDTKQELIRKIILLVSIFSAVFCLIMILTDAFSGDAQLKKDEEYRDMKNQIELTGEIPLDNETIERIREEVPNILDEYLPYYDINSELIGWIRIAGTIIDYPVVQGYDNDYYLTHNFERNPSSSGAIFADWHVPFTPTSRPNNTVMYGHNMNNGSYFAKVADYFPRKSGSLEYYKNHPVIEFDTIYEKGIYKIFAGIYINTQPEHNSGQVYEYYRKRVFEDKAAFFDFAQNIMDRSVFYTDVDLEYGDEIITLSTCYFPMGDNIDSRFVIFARRVREGEDPNPDVSKAFINPSPLYFTVYHNALGTKWGGRNWDLSLVKGLEEYLTEHPEGLVVNN